MQRMILVLALLFTASSAMALDVRDATGRDVVVPEHIQRVLPARPPAAVLLAAIAPDRMIGFPGPVSNQARALLAPSASDLPPVPRLTGPEDQTAAIQALHPDVIIDYGTVSPRYRQLAITTQQTTGIPTLLFDGGLDQIPSVARLLGVAWLRGGDPATLAALFNATVYDRVLTTQQLDEVAGSTPTINP